MSEIIHYKPGDVVIQEGDTDSGFYILRSGILSVLKGQVPICEFSKPNTVLGEMSCILNKPRTCQVVAKTECELIHLDQDIHDIIRTKPRLTLSLMQAMAQRLEQTTEKFATTESSAILSFEKPLEEER